MKRIWSAIICVLMFVELCGSLVSCGSKKGADWLVFDEKYICPGVEDSVNYYIFHSDHTGVHERHYSYESTVDSEYNYVLSGTVSFEWRVGSDGAIYLFETDVQYNDDHTENKRLKVPSSPIFGGEDFIVIESSDQYGIDYTRFVREGSKLEKVVEKD